MIGLPVLAMSSVTRSRKAISAGLKLPRPGPPGTPAAAGSSDVQPVDGLRRMPSTTTASTASLSASIVSVLAREVRADGRHEVDGVAAAPVAGQELVQLGEDVRLQRGQLEVVAGQLVRRQHAPASAERHDRHAAARRQRECGETQRQVQALVGARAHEAARLAGRGHEDVGRARHGAGVRCGCAAAVLRQAAAQHHHRLLRRDAAHDVDEAAAVADSLRDRRGRRRSASSSPSASSTSSALVLASLPTVTYLSMPMPRRSALVTSCTPMLPDWETMLRPPACGRSSRKPTAWSRLCVASRPMQLGPMSVTPAVPGRLDQLRLRGGPRLARLREARGHHERDGDPALAALLDHGVHVGGPQRHQRQVRGLRQLRDAAEGGQIAHGAATTVHGVDGAGEAAVDEVAQEGAAPFGEGRSRRRRP